ncbi:MAG: SDR family oxidoreductase [Solirubrobacteraceae bacterium]
MASSAARQASQSSAAYAAAKAGVLALSRHLALGLAPDRVRVNCLAPATVENEWIRSYMTDEQRRYMAASFPLGRIGRPDDIAAATAFLASQASSSITGITLDIAGGGVMP